MAEDLDVGLLDQRQGVALVIEAQAAQSLLRDATTLIRRIKVAIDDQHSVLAVASIGVEKLLKLSIGLRHLRDGQAWPSVTEFKLLGHGVLDMDKLVRDGLRTEAARSVYPHALLQHLDVLDSDETWPQLLQALDRYGREGRFHFLNWVADAQPTKDAPQGIWQDMESAIAIRDPHILAQWADIQNHESARTATNELIAAALSTWRSAIYQGWMQGALGTRARQLSSAIDPQT